MKKPVVFSLVHSQSMFMTIIMGLLTFLSVLALGISLSIGTGVMRWNAQWANMATVQVTDSNKIDATKKIIDENNSKIKSVRQISNEEMNNLMRPWISNGGNALKNYLPTMWEIEFNSESDLKDAQTEISKHARFLTHASALKSSTSAGWKMIGISTIVLLLTLGAIGVSISYIAKNTALLHKRELEILNQIGASDGFIANLLMPTLSSGPPPPWTIPANVAICINPDFTYVMIDLEGTKLVMAKDLVAAFLADTGRKDMPYTVLAEFGGRELEYITCKHPLYDRDSLIILGSHVTLDAGTGCVHTAPGHGADDFIVGKNYDLPVLCPVDGKGRFTEEAPGLEGMDTTAGGKVVAKMLEECGALIQLKMFGHQYPHCWRCHTPILFRATEQWFASIDSFRQTALDAIDGVQWIPSWGHDRIYNMIRDRGDWCISRQRTWGVPIPIFYCEDCGETVINDETIAHLQKLYREGKDGLIGSNTWFGLGEEDLLPAGFTCPKCGGTHFRKETDTMDVWFDSGSSHFAVLEHWDGQRWPADLYLEGSDQHRGWFNSSLCISIANRGVAPYKAVLTHGFIVDDKGIKQSKSLGNTTDPLKVVEQMGADVLRLWVSSTDYRSDIACAPSILKQVSEAYRKIRNTARYMLSNLYDFDLDKHMVDFKDMPEIDRWAMIQLQNLIAKVREAYDNYEFHVVYHSIHKFCVVDMSSFYLDVIKDIYADDPDCQRRRSMQTVLYKTIDALVRMLAPILSFTTEEIYSYMPKAADAPVSAQLLDMPEVDAAICDDELMARWETILACRELVSKELEKVRAANVIGHSLDAKVEIWPDEASAAALASVKDELAKIFIVSQVVLHDAEAEFRAEVHTADGEKCSRCWIHSESVGKNAETPELCDRCCSVMNK